ncbi:MAG: UDP-glucose 4-epimerase [uncultured Solirubrobacteraceae bacterium]|uniref:UDP-glucose 4-epimerase n=1 Tax=uncultured Solirubrobacteraceae bacterium TaxID=1162706 RepID=A0A6J4S3Y5_9ACTN|nr:MAG: UDP-glucose 4-epimerase [uncultured Solirubrobacteraceae bacterium]
MPGMAAKAIIDMVAVVHSMDGFEATVDPLRALGWVHAPEPDQAQPFRSFCTPDIAQRTHHLHVFEKTSDSWRDLLAFRNYLRVHPGLAAAYAALKRDLALQHGSDPNRREPYRVGKATFIQAVTALANRAPPHSAHRAPVAPAKAGIRPEGTIGRPLRNLSRDGAEVGRYGSPRRRIPGSKVIVVADLPEAGRCAPDAGRCAAGFLGSRRGS